MQEENVDTKLLHVTRDHAACILSMAQPRLVIIYFSGRQLNRLLQAIDRLFKDVPTRWAQIT